MSRLEAEGVLDSVVVGAGAAGLAAAAALHEAGRTFVVLEARDRIGGRAHTIRLSNGQAAERGAEYLHGARVATWEYVARFGLATHLASGPTQIAVPEFRRGEWWPAGASDSDRALQGLGAALAIPDAADVSLRDALSQAGFSGDRLRAAEGRMEVLSPIDPTVVSARSAAAAWRLVAPETACFVLTGGYGELWDNNAGIDYERLVADVDRAGVDRVFGVNVIGLILCCREAVRRMSRDHGGQGGNIVNISSVAARTGGLPKDVVYTASKGAVDAFTRGLSNEVAGQGVRVCAVRPGLTLTEIFESTLGQEGVTELARRAVPMGRIGQPDEVAAMVLWLCSSEASYVTGFTYDVSGGR